MSKFDILQHMKSLSLHKPHLLIVIGIPGSGKTFFAQQFTDTFSAPYISYDVLHDALGGHSSPEETAALAGILFEELTKTKQTILIEGPGATRSERIQLGQQAHAVGYEPLFVWVQTEPTAARQRAVKAGSSTDAFETGLHHFEPLAKTEKAVVISGKHTYASQARIVLKRLVQPEAAARQAVKPTVPERPPARGRISVQ